MHFYEIVSFSFEEFQESVWKLKIGELDCILDAYDNTFLSPNRTYPKGTLIAGKLLVYYARGRRITSPDEQIPCLKDLCANKFRNTGSSVQCVGKILGVDSEGDYEVDCGIKMSLQLDEDFDLQPGDWFDVKGGLYFDPDFSTLVMPPENALTTR